jgi:hypothetical protein
MGLAVSYLPWGTCCQDCPMFVSIAAMVFPGVEADAVAVAVAVVEALAFRAHALAGEGHLLFIAILLGLPFPSQSIAA